MKKIEASEMPLHHDGSVYHLRLHPQQLADKCILVGDPGRVALVSSLFDSIECQVSNREIITHTGTYQGKRISVLSTGMGTDNIDIVLNELDALVNIDLQTRTPKTTKKKLEIVRIGTSGSLQSDYPVDSLCASEYALGLDGLMNYYLLPCTPQEDAMREAFIEHARYPSQLAKPYLVGASEDLLQRIAFDIPKGITATAGGFYAPQGRILRTRISYPEQNDYLNSFQYQGHRISNLEMESSALFGLCRVLGHQALTVCVLIANRTDKSFSKDYHPAMENLISKVLDRI